MARSYYVTAMCQAVSDRYETLFIFFCIKIVGWQNTKGFVINADGLFPKLLSSLVKLRFLSAP